MARKKVVIEPIASGAARRTTFKKRKVSLFKKARELSALCDVEVCAIVSEGPHDTNDPEVWPPRKEDAMRVLSRFCGMSEVEKSKKMVDQVTYLSQQLEKMQVQLHKVQSENCELETALLLHGLLSGQYGVADMASFETMGNLAAMVERRLGEVGRRMSNLASASVPSLTDFDNWAPPPLAVFSAPAFGLTADVSLVQGWSTGSEEAGPKEGTGPNGRVLGEVGRRMSNLASASVPSLTDFDKWAPPPPAVFSAPAFGLTADVSSVQGWSTGSEEAGPKEGNGPNGCVLGPTGDDVAPMMVGSQQKEEDEIERLLNCSTYGFDYECDDEIAALLFS